MTKSFSDTFHDAVNTVLQPPTYVVKRPKIHKTAGSVAMGVGLFIFVLALAATLAFTYISTELPVTEELDTCEMPDSHPGEDCTEKTEYPKTVITSFHQAAVFEVTLNGPDHVSEDYIKEAIRGMRCEIQRAGIYDVLTYYYADGFRDTSPRDWRRSCTNPDMPGVTIEPRVDPGIEYLRMFWKMRDRFAVQPAPANVDNFLLTSVILATFRFGQEQGSHAEWKWEMADGTVYGVTRTHSCDRARAAWVDSNFLVRDCCVGYPYHSWGRGNSSCLGRNSSGICPYVTNAGVQRANQMVATAFQTPSIGRVVDVILNSSSTEDALDLILSRICERVNVSIEDFFNNAESSWNNNPPRPFDELVDTIASSVIRRCPYKFKCTRTEFKGLILWVALTLPWAASVITVIRFVIPMVYMGVQGLLPKRFQTKVSPEEEGPPESLRDAASRSESDGSNGRVLVAETKA